MKILIITFSLILILGCSKKIDEKSNEFVIDSTSATILEYNPEKKYMLSVFQDGSPRELEEQDLALIEDSMNKVIIKLNIIQREWFVQSSTQEPQEGYLLSDFLIQKSDYRRQYICVEDSQGEKWVWVNLFCKEHKYGENWKNSIIRVYGEGKCFWGFKLNLSTKKYSEIRIPSDA